MTTSVSVAIADPRSFPDPALAPPEAAALYRMAQGSLAADTALRADRLDCELRAALESLLAGDGATLVAIVAGAPSVSVAVARHLWRRARGAPRYRTEGLSRGGRASTARAQAVGLIGQRGPDATVLWRGPSLVAE